jgi:hypothetical protein
MTRIAQDQFGKQYLSGLLAPFGQVESDHEVGGWRAGLVAIDQLPRTEATLWLRVLGRGEVQAQAIRELLALPRSHPLRNPVMT